MNGCAGRKKTQLETANAQPHDSPKHPHRLGGELAIRLGPQSEDGHNMRRVRHRAGPFAPVARGALLCLAQGQTEPTCRPDAVQPGVGCVSIGRWSGGF